MKKNQVIFVLLACFAVGLALAGASQKPRAASNGLAVPMTTTVIAPPPPPVLQLKLLPPPGFKIQRSADLAQWDDTDITPQTTITVTNDSPQMFYRGMQRRAEAMLWMPSYVTYVVGYSNSVESSASNYFLLTAQGWGVFQKSTDHTNWTLLNCCDNKVVVAATQPVEFFRFNQIWGARLGTNTFVPQDNFLPLSIEALGLTNTATMFGETNWNYPINQL